MFSNPFFRRWLVPVTVAALVVAVSALICWSVQDRDSHPHSRPSTTATATHTPSPAPTPTRTASASAPPVTPPHTTAPAPTAAHRAFTTHLTRTRPITTPALRPRTPPPRTYAQPHAASRPGSARSYASAHLSSTQYSCLSSVVERESGWNIHATNPTSGAYGLGQALPGSKMASVGADWRTNGVTQIRWVISYMNHRYGSPCGAWSYWRAHRWY